MRPLWSLTHIAGVLLDVGGTQWPDRWPADPALAAKRLQAGKLEACARTKW